jgi:CDP-diglyceride synthetase
MPERRPNQREDVSPKQVAVHFVMGALLGTLGALFLVFSHASRIHQLFWANAAPASAIAVFVAMCALTIAIGASLTGVIFSAIEAERVAASKRRPPRKPR